MQEREKNRDIKNLLVVLGASVFCAAMLVFVFLHYYGPSGRYVAGHTILDPAIIQQIDYQEIEPKSGQKVHFIFDRFEFSYFDKKTGELRQIPVTNQSYLKFYNLISSVLSIEHPDAKIDQLFIQSHPTLLTTSMRTLEGIQKSTSQIFQIVQFIEEDYFRVQLHERVEQGVWVYFYLPHSYQDIMHLFTQSSE